MEPQFGSDLFTYELTDDMEEAKIELGTVFASSNMPHDWQIYAAFQLVEKQTILNIPTGYGKSHVLSTAAFILANRGERVTLLFQTELIKNRDQDNFAHLLRMRKDGEPLVSFEAIWGANRDGCPYLNFKPEIFDRRVLMDEIDVAFLDQTEFRDKIIPYVTMISGVTASATATDKTSLFEKEFLELLDFKVVPMDENYRPPEVNDTDDVEEMYS